MLTAEFSRKRRERIAEDLRELKAGAAALFHSYRDIAERYGVSSDLVKIVAKEYDVQSHKGRKHRFHKGPLSPKGLARQAEEEARNQRGAVLRAWSKHCKEFIQTHCTQLTTREIAEALGITDNWAWVL